MGLSASQGRLLLLTAKKSDLEYRAQQIAMLRAILCQEQEAASKEYEDATSNRIMNITLAAQAGKNDSASSSKVTYNLTYRNLISGTVTNSVASSLGGIQGSEGARTTDFEYASATPYRLMTADGAIVVSDESEIPLIKTHTVENDATQVEGKTNLYETKYDGKESTYSVLATGALAEIIGEDEDSISGLELDLANGVVRYTDDENNVRLFNIADGSEIDKDNDNRQNVKYETATISAYKDRSDIPKSKTSEDSAEGDYKLSPAGPDGIVTLQKRTPSGYVAVQRYLVDPGLKDGYYDNESGLSDINYLQDCLRNGKYMLQKCIQDENVDEGWRWTDISWDTATNVTDSYYTEDDATAKAKYDRIQSQIQAQDKKLELELDNIETQRSAVTTEIESVEKVINENIESTFNAFG
ncbi:MAG: hypothetical protein IJB79_01025 [Candidatus Gastranaerophilales bacterium]|nr:hypothetical protein [Candidatus Gastranaerophilales bacterium]